MCVGWAIQYEELDKLGLPSLDLQEFKSLIRSHIQTFDIDRILVREIAKFGNLLDVDDCLDSTKSLANALLTLIKYDQPDVFTIEVACRPAKGWNLDDVINRLSAQ